MATLKTKLKLVSLAALPVACFVATSEKLKIRKYTVESEKITAKVNALLLSDLHGAFYGENQGKLVSAIDKQKPDIIFLCGDITDEKTSYDAAVELVENIGKKYPCYYVPGNHEHRTGNIENIKKLFASYGINVLSGETCTAFVNGQPISVCGADEVMDEKAWRRQIIRLNNEKDDKAFCILLSHRPERIKSYNMCNFDLVLCGHAHGGLLRIPGVLNGLYAPGQGFFPKYAGGKYSLDSGEMVVGRGLAKGKIPRVFNPPEIVKIVITPKAEDNDTAEE